MSAKQHIDVLAVAQKNVDSAVSKTVNMDGRTMSWNEFKDLYRYAWESGCKSCSTFNISGKRMGMLEQADEQDGPTCSIDPNTGKLDCA